MILRATFENIYSFRNRTEISFIAGKGTALESHVCRAEKRDDLSILKSSIIYGANTSGKSNTIKAISLLKQIATKGLPKEGWNVFKLDETIKDDVRLELEMKIGNRYYAYGVVFNKQRIKEEWVYQITSRNEKRIYERTASDETSTIELGDVEGKNDTTQFLKFLSEGTPKNKSFLSEYHYRNGKGINALTDVYDWFSNSLKIIFPDTRFQGLSFQMEKDAAFSDATRSLLDYFNTSISSIKKIKVQKENIIDIPDKIIDDLLLNAKPNHNSFVNSMDGVSNYFFETDESGKTTIFKQKTIHKKENGSDVIFEMNEESDGSVRLMDFIPCLIDLKLNSTVYLIDEIDRSLHPMLTQKMFEYYYKSLSANRDTQLICTTHESHLLDTNLIRTDEVWFVEKDKGGATQLSSLAEYKPREDIRKGYLQGRYGAIPFFADINKLNWEQ